jgi:hypothetical protein
MGREQDSNFHDEALHNGGATPPMGGTLLMEV